jgi:hypothetical protein
MTFPNQDPYWAETANFLKSQVAAEHKVLAPDDFLLFPRIYGYTNTRQHPGVSYDWAVIHKGQLQEIAPEFLNSILERMLPVFANSVFVIWSSTEDIPELPTSSIHVQPMLDALKAARKGSAGDSARHNEDLVLVRANLWPQTAIASADGGRVWRPSTDSIGMKCFVVSLHRTGTRAMCAFLRTFLSVLQYPVRHKGIDLESKIRGREEDLEFIAETLGPALDAYDSVTDIPIPVLYRQLFRRYPTAKFILLLRDPFDWVRSVRRHIGERTLWPYERVQYWHYLQQRPLKLSEVDDQQLLRMNAKHTTDIIEFFTQMAPHNLGVFELGAENTGRVIAAFLGIDNNNPLPVIS